MHLDVKSAFLNGHLQETIFIQQPEGFEAKGEKKHYVRRLLKALYGLKQAARAWHQTIDRFLKSLGFVSSKADSSLYISGVNGDQIFALIYVDDFLLVARKKDTLQIVARSISSTFEIRVEPSIQKFLGMVITPGENGNALTLSNSPMINAMLHAFRVQTCTPVNTPLPSGFQEKSLLQGKESIEYCGEDVPYRQLVGALIHLSNTVRPDIAFAVGFLSRHMQDPTKAHWNAAKHVLKYLSGTCENGVTFKRQENTESKLVGFCDADFAGEIKDRRSTNGYAFLYSGGAVSWRSKLQTVIAQSTLEAEYISMSFASRELVWLRRLAVDFGKCSDSVSTVLFSDNQGAIRYCKNGTVSDSTKHIQVKFHYVRDLVCNKTIDLRYICTQDMIADIMTKALNHQKHLVHANGLGVILNLRK